MVLLNNQTIETKPLTSQLPGRRKLLALASVFTIPITVPVGTPGGV